MLQNFFGGSITQMSSDIFLVIGRKEKNGKEKKIFHRIQHIQSWSFALMNLAAFFFNFFSSNCRVSSTEKN